MKDAKLHKIAYKNLPFKKKSRKFALNMTSHASRWISAPGEVFEFYMIYNKKPLTLQEQVKKLKRCCNVSEEQLATEVREKCGRWMMKGEEIKKGEVDDARKF